MRLGESARWGLQGKVWSTACCFGCLRTTPYFSKFLCSCSAQNNVLLSNRLCRGFTWPKIRTRIGDWPVNMSPRRRSSVMRGLCHEAPTQREDRFSSKLTERIKVWCDLFVLYRDRSLLPAVYARSMQRRGGTAFPRGRRKSPREMSLSVLEKVCPQWLVPCWLGALISFMVPDENLMHHLLVSHTDPSAGDCDSSFDLFHF